MPAVYGVDLIAKRDRKIKMDRSIVKFWNVHYQTLEEVEEAERLKKQKQEEEARKNAERLANEEQESETQEHKKKQTDEAYNSKTGSYSGHYGKKPVSGR